MMERLTSKCEADPDKNAKLQREDIEYKVTMVVVRNAIVDPRAMAKYVSRILED
jgi:hypothetical protein